MKQSWDKLDQKRPPVPEEVSALVGSPLWAELCHWAEKELGVKPVFEYSRCCVPGWNLKYRKAGRGLCTLYPMPGYFTALVVISERERLETELILSSLTGYVQSLYWETKTGRGQKWLMIEVRSAEILEDVKRLIALRRGAKTLSEKGKK